MLTTFFPAHQAKKARPKTLIYLILQDISARSFDIIVHTFSIQFQSILLGFGNCSLQRQSSWGPYNNKPGEKYKGVKKKNENTWVTRGYNTILEKKIFYFSSFVYFLTNKMNTIQWISFNHKSFNNLHKLLWREKDWYSFSKYSKEMVFQIFLKIFLIPF